MNIQSADTITEVLHIELPIQLATEDHVIFSHTEDFYDALVDFCLDETGAVRLSTGMKAYSEATEINPSYVPSKAFSVEYAPHEHIQIELPNPANDIKQYEFIRNVMITTLTQRYERLMSLIESQYTFAFDASEICDEINHSSIRSLTEVSHAIEGYIEQNNIKIHPVFARAYLEQFDGLGFDLNTASPEVLTYQVLFILVEVDDEIDLSLTSLLPLNDYLKQKSESIGNAAQAA